MNFRQCLIISVVLAMLAVFASSTTYAAGDSRRSGKAVAQQQAKLTPKQAASKARAKHGGKVLKVTRAGKGYKVRLLQDSGRVITVTVGP